jgi:HD-like signal output (HDOD) protein
MPEVAYALIKTLSAEDVSAARVEVLIAKDPAITATVLRMANSALFGLSQNVCSLDKAISLIGMSQIRSRALSVCLANAFPVAPGMDRVAFWQGSLATAAYAQWLSGRLGMDPQQGWLTGLMLRLGEVIIAQRDPSLVSAIEQIPCGPGDRWAREQRLTGFNEGQITAELARRWDFPSDMVDALDGVMDPLATQALNRLSAILHLSSLLADSPDAGQATMDHLPANVLMVLSLDRGWMVSNAPNVSELTDVSSVST